MSSNKEDLKNKIIYRASYRGTKEMDILMLSFVNSIIDDLNFDELINLNKFVNLDDEYIKDLKNNLIVNSDIKTKIIKSFIKFKL
tara:strand:+ start:486 stop:740 length:255 start_codon:yes stop_codon:yes gene_type:complete